MIRGFNRLQAEDKGFKAESIQTFRVALGLRYAKQQQKVQYYERAQHDPAAIPAVKEVAFIYNPPLSRFDLVPPPVRLEGQSMAEAFRNPYVKSAAPTPATDPTSTRTNPLRMTIPSTVVRGVPTGAPRPSLYRRFGYAPGGPPRDMGTDAAECRRPG